MRPSHRRRPELGVRFFARASPWVAALSVVAASLFASSSEARADPIRMPRIGQQFFTVGLNLQPGFMFDDNPPADPDWGTVSPTNASMARVGFQQIVSESFLMSVDADLGVQWLNEHTAERRGRADSEFAVAWQLAITGRWVPGSGQSGWSFGGGPHLYTAHLRDRPLQSIGFDLKAGRYIWQRDEKFVLVELGYAVPFVQGLTRDDTVSGDREEFAPKNWTFHRFSFSIQFGF